MNYQLAIKLKDAGFPQKAGLHIGDTSSAICEIDHELAISRASIPSLYDLIEAVKDSVNEFAIGWNDSGCFWHFQYGERGCGSMLEGFGKTYDAIDADNIHDAVAGLWLKLQGKDS